MRHDARHLNILGVEIVDCEMSEAIRELHGYMSDTTGRSHYVYFVNAHTLNLASTDPDYQRVLRGADRVFGDGTGVRWAARMLHGVRLRGNVNGTDLVPELLRELRDCGLRYYLLGATEDAIARAAEHARGTFVGWTLVGSHHGYIEIDGSGELVDEINAVAPHLLLVGMGNPVQERWLHANRSRLRVPLCLGVGGLLTYWAGDLERAPLWMRRGGIEWLHLMNRQPRKTLRYLVGAPLFLLRVARARLFGTSPAEQA